LETRDEDGDIIARQRDKANSRREDEAWAVFGGRDRGKKTISDVSDYPTTRQVTAAKRGEDNFRIADNPPTG